MLVCAMDLTKTAIGVALVVLGTAGCGAGSAPGMVVSSHHLTSASVAPSVPMTSPATAQPTDDVTLLVAFPVTACTGTESAVFIDERGRFVGAVSPGTAASLRVARGAQHLFVVGSADVTAPVRMSFLRHEAPRRSDQGVIIRVPSADGHNCSGKWSGPLTVRPEAATLAATTEIARGLTWLEVRPTDGNGWLDENRARVDELVGSGGNASAPVVQPVETTVTPPR